MGYSQSVEVSGNNGDLVCDSISHINNGAQITGTVNNSCPNLHAGDRPLNQVDVNCIFYDPYGQVVLRDKVSIVKPKWGGLKRR